VSWNKVGSKGVVEDRHVHGKPKVSREEDGAWLTETEPKSVFLRRCHWVPCGNWRDSENRLWWASHVLGGRNKRIIVVKAEQKRRSEKK
jgi:hypothetical protein